MSSITTGQHYELLAKDYLLQQGLKSLEQNYHSRFGEIDLIMMDQNVLCFIEVKFRKNNAFGGAVSSIPRSKQQKIIKTAQSYLTSMPAMAQKPMRFDAVIIQPGSNTNKPGLNWIQNAFYAE